MTWTEEMNDLGKNGRAFFFLISYDAQEAKILLKKDADLNSDLLFDIQGHQNFIPPASLKAGAQIIAKKHPLKEYSYADSYKIVQDNLQAGNAFLVNLTAPHEIELEHSLEELFYLSQARYKMYWKDKWLCFSPETFVNIHNGRIRSHPMKGTIDASIKNAQEIILKDQKEMAEHATIVDLIRSDMSRVAHKVQVKRFRYVEKIEAGDKALLQVSSEIEGELPENYPEQIGSILASLLPAGSITGAPKPQTRLIIDQAESLFQLGSQPYQRGYYTGIGGYFDGKNLDSGVLIRFIEQEGSKFYFKSGGGVTALSEFSKEYEELIQKIYVPISRKYSP